MALEHESSTGLALAVRTAGSQTAFADVIRRRQSTVHNWLRGGKELPAELVFEVEAKLGISRHDLRPDLYPREDTAEASALGDEELAA
ncbi:MAG: cytoplasmic chaperone TorD [Citromicrobium sp.]|nr:cytoplasmic chaperone TorD [Citromicrobium sp.]|tara:strand:- start:13 stop:276 length:264 start_codon:yes stop_codon:yes gene_type:complete